MVRFSPQRSMAGPSTSGLPAAGVLNVGDTIELEVVAAGCSLGGHGAWVYLDAFGSEIPGLTIVGSAPGTTSAGASLVYHFHLKNGGGAALADAQASITLPAQTTFVSVTNPACTHSSGTVTCALGSVAAGATIDFDMTVSVSPGASGTVSLGNYSVSGTNYPALLGPLVSTNVVANTAPTAAPDSYSLAEDTPLTVAAPGLVANDTDGESNPLSAVLGAGPSHGTLTLNANGSFTYTPHANYSGTDSFTYRATDGLLQSGLTTVSLTITGVADAPTAGADSYSTAEDTSLVVPGPGLLANDTDGDGDSLTAVLVVGPAHGTLTLNANGSFTYVPAANYAGADSFTYRASDGGLLSAVQTVLIAVTAVNDAPTAVADSYGATEDVTLTVPAPGVLTNDTDVEGNGLTAILVTGPAHGTLTLNANGSFTYVPAPDYSGADGFTYRASDGTAASAPVTVALSIADVIDITASPRSGRAPGGVRVTIGGGGFGPAGTPASVTIGGVPGLQAEVLGPDTITFVTPPLPAGAAVDVVIQVAGGTPQTLTNAYLPLSVPPAGDPGDTDGDGIPDATELKYGLDPTDPGDAVRDPDGDGLDTRTEIGSGLHPTAPYVRYFAEGLTNEGVGTFIALANASAATMEAHLTFFRQGAPAVRHTVTIAGRTRSLVNVGAIPGLSEAAFGVAVEANEAIAADRTMSWNLGGEGGHGERAVEASTTWYFAEGATTGHFTLFYLLTNPGAVPATASLQFLRQIGEPITHTLVVPPYARVTVPVGPLDPGLQSADLGGVVTADRPIVAERSMYLSTPSRQWVAGTTGTGAPQPAARWFFAEGATGDFFDAWILVSNPGTADASVTVRYVADSGADVSRMHTVPAGRRITIRVADEDASLRNTSFGTTVTSAGGIPVVAERAMWWRADAQGWRAGHVAAGFTSAGHAWVTADGTSAADGSTDTFALVANTEGRAGTIRVTALFGDGTAPVERTFALAQNQRFTVRARQHFPEVVGKGFSFLIESVGTDPVAIVVDHSTYWTAGGEFWGAGTTAQGSRIR